MKLKRQRGQYDCGIAVAVMVTGQSFKFCREHLSPVKGLGCFTKDIQRLLNLLGVRNEISKTITERCILRQQGSNGSHFVLRYDGLTYDPAKGIYKEIPANVSEILSLI